MPDLKVEVTDFSPEFAKAAKSVMFPEVFPHVVAALNIIAHKHLIQWRKFTMGEAIPGTPRTIHSRGDYTKSINVDISDDQVKYINSQGPWTEWIEKGHGEVDLKPGLLSGPKAKQGKSGPYNVVHFRHGVPGTLSSNNPTPINIHNIIKQATDKADRVGGRGTSRVTSNQKVEGRQVRTYDWGYRIPVSQGGVSKTKETSKGPYTWKSGKYAGMVRMDASTSKAKSSQYITFRTVSTKSDPSSWILPPMEGIPIRQAVMDSLRTEVEAIIKMAIEEDLK